jgi:hypothetical protein
MLRRSLVVVVAAVTVILLAASAVEAAVRPFNAAQTVAGGCSSYDGDSVLTGGGSLFGYATCQNDSIRFFSRQPNGTVNPSQDSGFSGRVMAVAVDNAASYVLFSTSGEVRIGKRTHAGAFSWRTVGTVVSGFPTGDIIAANGQWFGVWSDVVGNQQELFSAGSAFGVRRVTTSGTVDDFEPTLAYSGATPVMIWVRLDFISGGSDLYEAKFLAGNWEAPQLFASAGTDNFAPDMAIAGGRTFVAWYRDGFIWVASNATSSGAFSSRMFNTGGFMPNVAASTTSGFVDHIFVAWTKFPTQTQDGQAFFAESASTGSVHQTWDGATIAPPRSNVAGVGGVATKATVTYLTDVDVAIRSQS